MLWLYRLNTACVIWLQHNAGSIRCINKGKAASVALQVAEFVDKGHLIHAEVCGNGGYILIRKAYVTLPAAAGTATLTAMHDFFILHTHISHGLRVDTVICGGRT